MYSFISPSFVFFYKFIFSSHYNIVYTSIFISSLALHFTSGHLHVNHLNDPTRCFVLFLLDLPQLLLLNWLKLVIHFLAYVHYDVVWRGLLSWNILTVLRTIRTSPILIQSLLARIFKLKSFFTLRKAKLRPNSNKLQALTALRLFFKTLWFIHALRFFVKTLCFLQALRFVHALRLFNHLRTYVTLQCFLTFALF